MKQVSRGRILAAAGILGIATAALVYTFLAAQIREAPGQVQIVIAKQGIAPGTVVDASMVDTRTFPQGSITQGTASAPEMVIGKVCSVPIKAGEPISTSSVESKNRLSQMIPPYMRAVSVAVDPISGVGGFLKPGDHVDVIATFDVNQGTLTKTVLQDVMLVALGSRVVGEDSSRVAGKPAETQAGAHATLVVLPADAEKLILADSKGKLRLALRRSDDFSRIQPKGITSRGMLGVVPPDVPREKPQVAAGVPSPTPPAQPIQVSARHGTPGSFADIRPASFSAAKPLPLPGTAAGGKPVRRIEIIRGTKVEEAVVSD